jgi:hypothetical protein
MWVEKVSKQGKCRKIFHLFKSSGWEQNKKYYFVANWGMKIESLKTTLKWKIRVFPSIFHKQKTLTKKKDTGN